MDIRAWLTGQKETLKQRNILAIAVLVQIIIILMLSVAVVVRKERVIVIPPRLDNPFYQEGDMVAPSLMRELSLFIVHLLLDVNPDNVNHNFRVVLDQYVSAEGYDFMRSWFARERDRIKDERVSTTFHPKDIEVKDLNVVVEGQVTRKVSGSELDHKKVRIHLNWSMTSMGLKLIKVVEEKHDET